MKKIILNLLALTALVIAFSACEKDENQVIFQEGKAPVLSANLADSVALAKDNKDLPAITFNWTNPNYKFNTGQSSQDVNYVVQMRKQGSTAWVNTSISSVNVSSTINQGAFNDFMIKSTAEGGLELPFDVVNRIEVRVVSYLGALSASNATNFSSNILVFKVKPYSVLPDLWITGDGTASGWTNTPPNTQKFTYNPGTRKFTISIMLTSGKAYKFLEKQGAWQPQWGGCPPTGGNISVNDGTGSDPDAIGTPPVTSTKTIIVDLVARTCVIQ